MNSNKHTNIKSGSNRSNRAWSDAYTRGYGMMGVMLTVAGGVGGLGLVFLAGIWLLALAAVGKAVDVDH